MRILLIEDDKLIGDGIKAGLTKLGFNLDWFTDGAVGQNALDSAPYDAVILDLSLPGLDGLDLLRQWRQAGQDVPVLILTACDALEQRVSGLQSGADDYLCKPFALAEVAARLQALIRRRHGQLMPQLTHGNVVFDSATRSVSCNGEPVTLTPRELAVLELFLHNKGRVLARPLIQEKLYNWDDEVSSNAVEVHIHHLRRKLGNGFIRTIHGVGYTLVDALNALFARINALLVRERRFTSDAAHELRSPLAALRVQTEVVQLAGDDAPMREHALDNLTLGIDRATRLVDQLLTLSRLDSLSDLAELAPIDWNNLVTMTLAEQDRQAHAAGVTLRYEHRGTPPRQGETLLLSLLLRNLLDNAVRYTPQGGVVTVTLSERSLTVEDDGPGVTTEHLARLGERFYRPPGQEQTGSGLGLSIVQRIAGLHGLQISFANRPAGGFVARLAL